MDSLTRSLIKPFLPESIDGKEVTAVFGGGFKPPTAGHLSVIQKALQDHPEIDNVVIYVGGKVRDGITQDQSFKIWDEHYKTLIDRPVRIEKSVAPIKDIYRYAKDNPEDITYFLLGARQDREDDLQDIVNRSKSISKYPNLQLKTISTPDGGMSGTNARKALMLNDKEAFNFFVPSNIDYNEVWNILTSQPLNEGDPKVGTGKKPKGSGRRLYTDENPKDTVKVKFSTKQDIIDTLNKSPFKSKSHARQSQVINLIHQRVRAAYNRAKDPDVKKRLKSALDYAEQRKEASKKKTERLKKQKLKENQMSMDDFNLVGAVLRDKNKAKKIHKLLLQMFPQQKELLDYNYKNDSYAEFKRVIFHIDKYNIEGPKLIQHTKLKLDPEIYKERDRKYKEYAEGKIKKYFRDSDSDPRTLDLSKLPPITIDSGGEVIDGNHRAFLAIKQQKPLKAYQIVDAKNDHANVEKILNIVGRKKQKTNEAIDTNFDKVKFYHDYYTNVSPSTFEITLEENDIRISNIVEPYPSNFGPENVRQIPVNQNLEENIDPKSQSKHKGKSSPFGSAYEKVDETGLKIAKKNMDDYKRSNNPSGKKPKDPFGLNQFAREIMQEEELSYDTFDYPKHIKSLTKFMLNKGMELRPLPTVKFINDDVRNAEDFFGKTAYYDPNNHRIVLYTLNRHPKDVMRSFAHEMIHHMQNHEGKLETIHTQNTNEEGDLPEIEREAYEKGNMTFRSWTDTITEGVLKEGRYDTLSNQISRDIFNFWKEDFDEGAEDSTYEDNYDFPPNGIQVKAQITYKPGFKKLKVDGGSDIASKTLPGYLEVNFIVDPKMLPEFWEEISMNLKDVVRHEIEHITQLGTSRTKKEDFDEDFDTTIRALVKAKIIPQAEYFKLPREVDANLQGMYFRAKKERRPFADVINTYLDAQDITPKDKQIILNLWRSRRKALSLPKF